MKKHLLIISLLLFLPALAHGQSNRDVVFVTADPFQCATNKLYYNRTNRKLFGNSGTSLGCSTVSGSSGGGSGGGDALTTSPLSQFAATSSAQLAGVLTDKTGTNAVVFNNTPTLITPIIASFANATHNHANGAGGGQITDTALSAAVGIPKGGTGGTTAAEARTNLGIAIGTDVQAFDSDLATIAGLSPISNNFMVAVGGAWASVTPASVTPLLTNAVADGATKGIAAFATADFNTTSGVVSIDYTNGQVASGSAKGFLTAADWTAFNNKGTVSVVAAGNLTSTAIVTGGGTTTLQTPNAAAGIDTSGNISTPGTVTTGVGSSQAGAVDLREGTAQTLAADTFTIMAPTDVAAGGLAYVVPGAASTGVMLATNSAGVMTISHVAPGTSGNVLTSNGTTWVSSAPSGGGGTPGGSDTQLQRNNAGSFGGISGCTSAGTNITCTSGNLIATSPKFVTSIKDTNGNDVMGLTATASAVNNFNNANAATGNGPTLSAVGSDTNIDINLTPKGSGTVKINGTGTSSVGIGDTDNSHFLKLTVGSNLTADRVFTITTGDAARTLDISGGNLTLAGAFTTSGANALTLTTTGTTNVTLPTTGTLATTVSSGTSALGTSAISSGACATVVTTTATGTATTDTIGWGFNGDPTGVTGYQASANGMLTIIAYPSANNVNFKVCNNTASSITPGAVTLNWRVAR